jgi:hypothetical protein
MARELAVSCALALALIASCDKERAAAPASTTEGATEAAAKGAPPLAEKPFYRVDAKPVAPCASGATCEAQLVLTALGDYHVNDEYPTKFVADATGEDAVEGHTFEIDGAKRGTLTVRFKAAKPGPATLTGTFKLSVCNEDNCEIEAPAIALPVTSS